VSGSHPFPTAERRNHELGAPPGWRACAGLQVHGGNGYTTERAVERYWRDARLTTIFEGTSEIQRKVISDQLLRRDRTGGTGHA